MSAFSLRQMTPADSPALAALTEQSPDGGKITFSPRFHLPAYETFTAHTNEVIGVVAEAQGATGLVGSGRVSMGECQFEGRLIPYALLSSLVVHPNYRKQGIASALAQWRIAKATERYGDDLLILADIQAGNVGSIANAQKWADQLSGHLLTSPVPMRSKPPRPNSDVVIRPATADDLETIAGELNRFYADYNLYLPQTAERLNQWLQKTPFDSPIHHYMVVTDSKNRLLAGIGITEEWRLMSIYIEKVPTLISLANLVLKVIPPDREMRPLQAEKMWFAPNGLEAARYLWQTLRWTWRDRGSSLVCNYDPRSPIRQWLQVPFWMPTTSVSIASRAPQRMSAERLIAPLI